MVFQTGSAALAAVFITLSILSTRATGTAHALAAIATALGEPFLVLIERPEEVGYFEGFASHCFDMLRKLSLESRWTPSHRRLLSGPSRVLGWMTFPSTVTVSRCSCFLVW